MNIINKYKNSILLNHDGVLNYVVKNIKINESINHIFNKKFNIIRNFIYFYSVFLIFLPFSVYQHKNNQEFRINIDLLSMLVLKEEYNNFFLIYS